VRHSRRIAAWTTAAVLGTASIAAQGLAPGGEPAAGAKPGILGRVGIDQRIGEAIPLDIPLVDEHGRTVRLGEFFGRRPVILALVYYECPMLCTQVLNGLVSALSVMNFEPGNQFEVVAVSFNPKEGPALAAQKKQTYIERYGRPHTAQAWHFLTGTEQSIERLTQAVGFRYEFDPKIQQYAHGAGIELLTPKGTLSKYFYGIEFSPRDIRFGLIEASADRIGTPVDDVLLLCYHYDPESGRYSATVLGLVRLGGVLTMAAVALFVGVSLRRERRDTHGAAHANRT
jgi:protein SCO1